MRLQILSALPGQVNVKSTDATQVLKPQSALKQAHVGLPIAFAADQQHTQYTGIPLCPDACNFTRVQPDENIWRGLFAKVDRARTIWPSLSPWETNCKSKNFAEARSALKYRHLGFPIAIASDQEHNQHEGIRGLPRKTCWIMHAQSLLQAARCLCSRICILKKRQELALFEGRRCLRVPTAQSTVLKPTLQGSVQRLQH